jgi:hypothetical protein
MSAGKLGPKCVTLAMQCNKLNINHTPLAEYPAGHRQPSLVLATAYTVNPSCIQSIPLSSIPDNEQHCPREDSGLPRCATNLDSNGYRFLRRKQPWLSGTLSRTSYLDAGFDAHRRKRRSVLPSDASPYTPRNTTHLCVFIPSSTRDRQQTTFRCG